MGKKLTLEEFENWLDGWHCSDENRWSVLRAACLQHWAISDDFRGFVEAMIEQDRPEEVLCWVASTL